MFDKEFQKKLVALLLRSPMHAKQIAMLLNPRWIENEALADVAHVAIEYVTKYRSSPTKLVISQECGKDVINSKVVQGVYEVPLREAQYIADKFTDFCKNRAIHEAVVEAAKDVKAERVSEEIIARLSRAMAIGSNVSDIGSRLRDFEKRRPWYLNDHRLLRVVPTGWSAVDHLMEGGLGAGELGIVMGPAKAGKSFFLTNIGFRSLTHPPTWARDGIGLKVFHYTCELSEIKTFRRYDKLLAGREHEQIRSNPKKFIDRVERRCGMIFHPESDLLVRQFPNQTLTPSMLRAHLDLVSAQMGWEPDLLIVDYLDEMAPERRSKERRFELSSIASDLRAIGIERNCPVWTATQSNKESFSKKVVRKEDIAEDVGKVRIADALWSICATPEEYLEGRMRLFAAAMRDNRSEVSVDMTFDFDRGIIRSYGYNEPVPFVKKEQSSRENDKIEEGMMAMKKLQKDRFPARTKKKEA